jgi:protein TonB
MASPTDIDTKLPDTLPADFGEWDSSDSQAAPPAEAPTSKPPQKTPKETAQRESARREAEAIDFAGKPFVAREVSRESEPARNVTPFPEPEEIPAAPPRGIPTPIVRAPRTSPAPTPVPIPVTEDDSALKRRLNATFSDKPAAVEVRKGEPVAARVSLAKPKPDKPRFSSADVEDSETSETALLNNLLQEEADRKTRKKWIISGCVFGGALALAVFQLVHYSSGRKTKHIEIAPQVAATRFDSDPVPDTVADLKPFPEKPSPIKQSVEPEVVQDAPQKAATTAPAAAQTQMMKSQLMAPTRLPQNLKTVAPNDAPPPASLGGASMAALNGNNTVGNVFAGQRNANVSGPKVLGISAGVAVGMLIHHPQPVYPPIARSARVQGTVVLNALISRTGKVTDVKVVSGPPMLRQSAIDAVRTWQYKPYTLNNEPVEINTTVNVVFSLGS